jgi:hypothetical protein
MTTKIIFALTAVAVAAAALWWAALRLRDWLEQPASAWYWR